MSVLMRPWGHLHFRQTGPRGGLPVVLLNSLGTDLRMWQAVTDRLPRPAAWGWTSAATGCRHPAEAWTARRSGRRRAGADGPSWAATAR